MTIQAKNYQPDIMYGAALSVTNISTISDVSSTTTNAVSYDATLITTGNTMSVTETGTTLQAGGAVLYVGMDANTVGQAISVVGSGVYTGTGVVLITQSSATTGTIVSVVANGLTTGNALKVASSGVIATTGNLASLAATGLTTGTALNMGTLPALTTGVGIKIAHATSVIADGGSLIQISSSSTDTGGATNGTLLDVKGTGQLAGTQVRVDSIQTTGTVMSIIGTGIMTGAGNLLTLTANSATSAAGLVRVNGTAMTTGQMAVFTGAYANLTGAGRYIGFNDGTSNVLSIGQNGHIHTLLGGATAPVMAAGTQQGITAAAIVAGSTDVCGAFTTTGTQNNTADSTVTLTFDKTYTAAPKAVILTGANASAGTAGQCIPYIVSITATVVTIGFGKNSACTATPSYYYMVIA